MTLPYHIEQEEQLDQLLSQPSPQTIDVIQRMDGDWIFLGVGGKMGPTLARMAKHSAEEAGVTRRIIGVSRFSNPESKAQLEQWGIEAISCDLLNESELRTLPQVKNVVYLAGMKFGATGNEALTWAMNCYLPSLVCQHFNESRIVAFSTGNVYGMQPIFYGGARETDYPRPDGDYAMSCLGRERIFEYFSTKYKIPVSLIRLYYATELRYGVLRDICQQVWDEQPISLAMGSLNAIWQGDANNMALGAMDYASAPPFILNVVGPEILSVRQIALKFAQLLNKEVRFEGEEQTYTLLGNGQLSHGLFGYPSVTTDHMVRWISQWVMQGGSSLNKPTHFEVRDGKY
jgi:nucleoside-diphosphate-sugar epimerase